MRRLVLIALALLGAAPLQAEEPTFRYRAPITLDAPAAFVLLPLPASAYGRSLQTGLPGLPDLPDLRLVDAKNEAVPFAILAPRAAELRSTEQQREATLYPLPARPAADGHWAAPIEIAVQGGSISVKRLGRSTVGTVGSDAGRSGGWLVDTGERKRGEPAPQSLRARWSGPAEFSAAYRLETSDDLRAWRGGGTGQLLAFSAQSGALTQPTIALPPGAGRFVRLVWADAAAAPAITGVQVVAAIERSVAIDPPTELVLSMITAPSDPSDTRANGGPPQRALQVDLGGVLPLSSVDLRLPPGTRVAPLRLQGRTREAEPWRELGSTVFYRLERDGQTSTSPPLALQASARWLRLLPDPRAAALDPAQVQLVVQAQLARLVFVQQGTPPFSLLAGSSTAKPAALAATSLVPALDDERPRFGRASLGAWSEDGDVARATDRQRQRAALRPWLLWAVLLAGVGGLGFMVWRLTRPAKPGP